MNKNHIKNIFICIGICIICIVGIPILINILILKPRLFDIVGTSTDWLSFWGGYLGAIISAGVAFAILCIQRQDNEKQSKKNRDENKIQNNSNRQLQLNVIKYQQQVQWLNELKSKCIEYFNAFDQNDIINLCNLIHKNKKETILEAEELINKLINKNNKATFAIEFLFTKERDEEEIKTLSKLQEYNLAFKALICDTQYIVRILKKNEDPNQLFINIDDYKKENKIPQITENRLVDVLNNYNHFFLTEYTSFINQLFRARKNFNSILIQSTLSELLNYEENKINKIIDLEQDGTR